MAEDHGDIGGAPARHIEPGCQARRRVVGAFFHLEVHAALGVDEAHASKAIDDGAQSVVARQRIAPAGGCIAVHHPQEVDPVGPAQHRLHFCCERHRLFGRPLRKDAGMDHQVAVCQMGEWAGADPVEQRRTVVGQHDVVQRVAAMSFANTGGRCQQVQVMVAKHDGGAIAQGPQPAQRRERMRPAIDQVAREPQRA